MVLGSLATVGACDTKSEPGADSERPAADGSPDADERTDSTPDTPECIVERDTGCRGETRDAKQNDCCPNEDASASVEDARGDSENEAEAGCSCSPEGAQIYRMTLACFCDGSGCPMKYDLAEIMGWCDPPSAPVKTHTQVRLIAYSGCSLIGAEVTAIDAPPKTWFFNTDTNRLVGVSYGPAQQPQYLPKPICQDAGPYSVVAGALPSCTGMFVRNVCPDGDAATGDAP
jgi:hypothetical protein